MNSWLIQVIYPDESTSRHIVHSPEEYALIDVLSQVLRTHHPDLPVKGSRVSITGLPPEDPNLSPC